MLKSFAMKWEYPPVPINEAQMRAVIAASLKAGREGQQIFAEQPELPEKQFIDLVTEHGRKIGDEKFALNALFLTTSLVFNQDTYNFFGRITKPGLLDKYGWLFQPEKVVAAADAGIDIETACKDFFHPAGHSKNAIKEWVHNCRVLHEKYQDDIRNFFTENENDAEKVIEALVVSPRAKNKEGLRRFGPGLSRLFVQWVNQYDLYQLTRAEEIGLKVDIWITRILIQTGCIPLEGPIQAHALTYKALLPAFTRMCAENEWNPREVSEALWLIGIFCCKKGRHDLCPVENKCNKQRPNDPFKGGRF